jgi:hypothetical protein
MTATTQQTSRVGERVELARYAIPAGERIIYGQRVNGTVRVSDHPAGTEGRAVLIERELQHDGYKALQALIADYLDQARAHDEIPMLCTVL